jgi:hypothetical protein
MLQFRNETGFEGTVFASADPDGVDSLYAVIKGTFDLARGLAVADEQVPIVAADEHYGDPAASSIKAPSDICLMKPGTDVLLIGQAHAHRGQPAAHVDVHLEVGPVHKIVRVFGERYWQANATGVSITSPEPFTAMPLVWERAFGGTEATEQGPDAEPRNPVGRGFRSAHSERPLDGLPLPNLEDPFSPIESWKQRPAPVCFAPIAAHWQPRASWAGTYDERWQQDRAPYLPRDFDPRFFQVAPPGLVAPPLRGGERVEVLGAHPWGRLSFALPTVQVGVTYQVNGSSQPRPARLDTVIIEPEAARVVLVWRSVLACDKQLLRVREVRADLAANG